jgi:hypothetical protein
MEIQITNQVPPHLRPMRVYETKYLYTGFSRYDTEAKILSTLTTTETGKILYSERDYSGSLSRSYTTELVRVTIYSQTPKMWSEEIAPGVLHFFQQIPQQVDVT